jgi:hypothetical protein
MHFSPRGLKTAFQIVAVASALVALSGCSGSSSSSTTKIRAVDTIYTGTATFTTLVSGATLPTSLGTIAYGGSTFYQSATTGSNTIYATQNTSSLTSNSIATINSGNHYTAFLFGPPSSATLGTLDIAADDQTTPATGNTRLRIIHAASDLGALDVYKNGSDLVSDQTFANYSASYNEFSAGMYQFDAYPTGTSTTAQATQTFTLNAGQLYTLLITEKSSGHYEMIMINDSNS